MPAIENCSQLNKVSRTRSGVGRSPGESGKCTRRPRHPPPTMRTELRLPGAGFWDFGAVTPRIISRLRPLRRIAAARSRARREPSLLSFAIMTNEADKPGVRGFFKRLRAKLNVGPAWLTTDITELLPGRKIDAEILDDLETRLITADVGMEATGRILDELRRRVARKELDDVDALLAALRKAMVDILKPRRARRWSSIPPSSPTSFSSSASTARARPPPSGSWPTGCSPRGGASCSRRAIRSARRPREQLTIWAERNRVPIISQHRARSRRRSSSTPCRLRGRGTSTC